MFLGDMGAEVIKIEKQGRGDGSQSDHGTRCAREETERDPRVLHVMNPEDAHDVIALVEREVARDDDLRELIRRHRGERDRGEAHPLHCAGAERALRNRDRPQAVLHRPDTDVGCANGPREGRIGHRCSAFLASSMQSEAHGYASRRSSAISLPHTVQMPKVPSSMRFSAASMSPRTRPEFSSSV